MTFIALQGQKKKKRLACSIVPFVQNDDYITYLQGQSFCSGLLDTIFSSPTMFIIIPITLP